MSAISETIVREYFEQQGFLVLQPRKYAVAARAKRPDEEVDLLIVNPRVATHQPPPLDTWRGADLQHIARAIVGVRGWHTDRFSPAVLDLSPEIFRFAEAESVRRAAEVLGEGPVAKILCLPGLSATDTLRRRSLEILKEKGIDGVLSFPTMLIELIEGIEVSKSYEKSDVLQILRILKNYELLKEPQLELFKKRSRK